MLRLVPFALVMGLACTPSQAPPPSSEPAAPHAEPPPPSSEPAAPHTEPPPPAPYPQVHLDAQNLWADEGEDWRVVVRADGSFHRVHTWSDGADDFVTTCDGRLSSDQVAPWLRRLGKAATHAEPVTVTREEAERTGLLMTAKHVPSEGEGSYVDPRPLAAELEAWLTTVAQAEGACHEEPL